MLFSINFRDCMDLSSETEKKKSCQNVKWLHRLVKHRFDVLSCFSDLQKQSAHLVFLEDFFAFSVIKFSCMHLLPRHKRCSVTKLLYMQATLVKMDTITKYRYNLSRIRRALRKQRRRSASQ